MLLAIDIGNSNVTIGLAKGADWAHIWRLPTRTDLDALLFYEVQLSNHLLEVDLPHGALTQVVISSVVPDLTGVFEHLGQHLFGFAPLVVRPDIYAHLPLGIARPNEIGTDLLANALAAHQLFREDCIVVDFGTALTFTTVDAGGQILGVSIAPGLKTAISALFQKTAQLPEVPLEYPRSAIGKNTVHAIQSGVLIGYVGLVRYMLQAIREEVGTHYLAVATGGLSAILHPLRDDFFVVDPNLTLNGLRMIGEIVPGPQR